ncbi:MAG: high frequency lysogenization protein HflD [Methylococcaceae bacterium]|nr:high frequency lysogenization protein HflD [Methylococcaceae bacterium]
MKKTIHNQVIALAGLAQAVYLVKQIARHGTADADAVEASIESVLKIDARDIEDVYGGLDKLRTGIRQLKKQLQGPPTLDPEQFNYAATLVYLERKLVSDRNLLLKLRHGIEELAPKNGSGKVGESVMSKLADLYQNTVSTLSPRILVNGEPIHLTNPDNAIKIRALLLAGIRSAFLWQQSGGRRWKLVLFRKRLLAESEKLARAA